MDDRPINNFLILLGGVGCLAVFGYLIWLVKVMQGISTAQIVCLLFVFIVSLLLVAGQVKVTTSITSGDTDDE